MTRAVVVGGGIAGLAAAWQLLRSGVHVTLVEAADRVGGKIVTEEVDGRPVDLGPDAFLARVPDGVELCRELGLGGELVAPATSGAAIWTRGRLRPLPAELVLGAPTGLASLARSGILGPAGLARATLDLVLPGQGGDEDRSVGALVTARFGRQVHERLVDPLLGAIHAGPSGQLSARAAAPQLAAAARARRSLLLGLRAQQRGGGPAGDQPVFLSLLGGLGRLAQRLEEALRAGGAELELGTSVTALPPPDADVTVLATPAPAAADLLAGPSPDAAGELRAVDHASVVLAVLCYPAAALPRPLVGTGFLVPRGEGRLLTACSFASSKWPHWAAPRQVVLRASAGRWGDERALDMDDDELVGRLHEELAQALSLRTGPDVARVARWPRAFPQYRVGHLERVERIEALVARDLPGVVLAGAAYRGLGVTACIGQGRAAARRALASSPPPGGRGG